MLVISVIRIFEPLNSKEHGKLVVPEFLKQEHARVIINKRMDLAGSALELQLFY